MSGGSWEYSYHTLERIAEALLEDRTSFWDDYESDEEYRIEKLQSYGKDLLKLRREFAEHLMLVAQALHDIEWVDSADMSPGDEIEAINKVLGKGKKRGKK